MKTTLFILLLIFLVGCAPAAQVSSNHKVLMIGDSISIGYTPYVRANLESKGYSILQYIQSNGQIINAGNSSFTLQNVRTWLAQCPDCSTVVWNNGIWDSMRVDKSQALGHDWQYHTSDELYASNIAAIAAILKENDRRVIFLTSTDVPEAEADTFDYFRIPELNAIAKNVLAPLEVEIYDLGAISENMKDEHDGVTPHWNAEANALLGDVIAKVISHSLIGN